MILIRFVLVSVVVYLIIRSFIRFGKDDEPSVHRAEPEKESKISNKGVSKEIGEYVDYEEVDK
jgi:large-conductance mechanosensitive channel